MINHLPGCTRILHEGIERGLHIGAQVCVSLRGELVADFALGNAGAGRPMRTDHRILWMSAGKPLIALALAQIWEDGRLSPDESVSEYLPEFAQNGKEGVLVRHLLTHTHAYQPPAIDWPRLAWSEIIERICASRIPEGREPGQYAAYDAQTTWYLLAEIVQRLTATSFYDFVRSAVLDPLGCNTTCIGMSAESYTRMVEADQIALMHDTSATSRDGRFENGTAPIWAGDNALRAAAHNPGGGTLGPARELCRFYEALGKIWHGEPGIVSSATVRQMTSRVREGLLDHTFRQRVDWGLGFLVNSYRYSADATPYGYGKWASDDTFGHGGVQSSSGFCDPERDLAVAVIYNGMPGEAKHNKRAREVNSALYEDLALVP